MGVWCLQVLGESPIDLTGLWQAEKIVEGKVVTGELKIVQSGEKIEAMSTTGRSVWIGMLKESVLFATYLSATDSGKITLRVSTDGQDLEGDWVSDNGPTGLYRAHKQKSDGQI
jgi:hypothetical protein